jgi:hypothetical protein
MATTTFVQVNIKKTTANFSGSVTPTITIDDNASFQGSAVKFSAIFPVGTTMSSIGHVEGQNVETGDTITVDLGNGNTCTGTIEDPNGLNVVNCTV